MGALGSDHVVHHSRTQELDVLLANPRGESSGTADSVGGISERNEHSFPQGFEVIVKPGHGGQ